MAKNKTENVAKETPETSPLEALAVRLEGMAKEAMDLGEERVVKTIGYAVKSARWADKQRSARLRRVGQIISQMKAKGLSPEEIVARLSG